MKKLIYLWALFFYSTMANAYFVTSFKNTTVDTNRPTRIIVTGTGKEQETQFQEVAYAKTLKYFELYPNEQIILIAKNETPRSMENITYLKNLGYVIQSENKATFTGEALVKEMLKFKKISSIDIFSHGTALYGLYLENYGNRFTLETKGITELKNHFNKDAYFMMHGCNAGYFAPNLSALLEIPVAAAMTSTDFQRLHSDGDFYLTEKGFYPNKDWARRNDKSFEEETSCRNGKCIRLKPDNHSYVGLWGEYKAGGLPFYKFFCVKNSISNCERAMAKSLYGFLSITSINEKSSFEDYKKVVIDFLCPISAKKNLRGECEENLDRALVTKDGIGYNPFRGRMLDCNFSTCHSDFVCSKLSPSNIPNAKTCISINRSDKSERQSTTLVREYMAYLDGFRLLHQE